jgi:hypothetical protein
MRSTLVRSALALMLVAGAASCSSDKGSDASTTTTTSSTSTTKPVPFGAVLHAKARWTGAVDVSGSYTVEYRSFEPGRNSCAGLARASGPGATFAVPVPERLGSYRVDAIAAASPFAGAGEYGADRFAKVTVTLTKVGSTTARRFAANARSHVHLTVAADGSGRFQFANLAGPSSTSLSGTISWTCD